MLFKHEFHAGLRDGSITLTFRRWSRPQVKVGGRYHYPFGQLEVDALEEVRARDIRAADARRSGFASRDALLAALERRGAPLHPADRVYRIALHYAGAAPRPRVADGDGLSDEELDDLRRRVGRMDARSASGPWTRSTLALIGKHPRTAASRLAAKLDRETQPFKADVRKLKRLGLTHSFEIGYELSPRGREFLSRTKVRRRT